MHKNKEMDLTLEPPVLGIKVTKDIFHSFRINSLARNLLKRFTKSFLYLYGKYASILLLILSRPEADFFFAAEITRSKCLTVTGESISSKIAPSVENSCHLPSSFPLNSLSYLESRTAGITSEWLSK